MDFPSLMKERKFIDGVDKLTIFIEEKSETGIFKNIYIKENLSGKDKGLEIKITK